MFNPFKRSPPVAAEPAPRAAPPKTVPNRAPAAAVPAEPVPLPEVVEGNEPTDWALWEDSVMVMDSQMQGLTPSAQIYDRNKESPSAFDDLDPFSSIRKNSP